MDNPTSSGKSRQEQTIRHKKPWRKRKRILIALIIAVVFVIVAGCVVMYLAKSYTEQESAVRSDWAQDAGDLIGSDEENNLEIRESSAEASIEVLQIVPEEIEEDGFTYYDESVQERIANSLSNAQQHGDWSAEKPLAILNPYGTGPNGLYLYFTTDFKTQISYTISAEGTQDYEATASGGYTTEHSIQIIGLVPGKTNEVTITATGEWGVVRQEITFSITMPETQSGYATELSYTNGESNQELSQGLYAMMRTNGYLGYGFFFDNEGTMRYEMILEGFGLDRILEYDDSIVTCISSTKLARISSTGQVEQVYPLDGYELHHDVNFGEDNTVLALAEHTDTETVEDVVLEIDLDTGNVTELVDFSDLMDDFYEDYTRPVTATDPFFWQAGEWDWIHINSVQYLEEDDSIIISSRETSSLIKVTNVHNDPEVDWIAGDPQFWEGTPYEEYCLDQASDFLYQYGQHAAELIEYDDTEEGVYYLRLYNNNYCGVSSRDDFSINLDSRVGTGLYDDGDDVSLVYIYRIDENERTFDLVESFEVPYSSIVSNASQIDNESDENNWVVNSGVAAVFGEYDSEGTLIRQFSYDCDMQGYRTFKYDFEGFWFAEE